MISIRHLAKVYGETRVLRDVSCDIEQGEVVSVIGPSGTGKSTMLRCINLLERPTSGQIVVDGQDVCGDDVDVTALRLKVGMVFQSFNLFSHLTVIENLMMAPCDLLGMGRTDAYRRAMQLLSQVGLPDRRLAYPDELSGGQRQRVAIARTLMMDPDTILFDEPTSALDPTMVGEVKAVIRDLAHTRKTLIIVTHELEFARSISSRVLYLDQGVVYEQGSPEEIFERPGRERTRQFVMRLKVLELTLEGPLIDLPGAFGAIEAYCIKNQVPKGLQAHMELAFDELCVGTLLTRVKDPLIAVTFEYDERLRSATMVVRFNAGPEAVCEEGDEDDLAFRVLSTVVSEHRVEACDADEAPYRTKVELRLRS